MPQFTLREGRLRILFCALLTLLLGGCGALGPLARELDAERCGNGIDDDLDGQLDEGCPCRAGEVQSCFGGLHLNRSVGLCADGRSSCEVGDSEFGAWGACETDVRPAGEVCEGSADEDCDGAIDEGCPCTSEESRSCAETFVQGPCASGVQSCQAGTWSACVGAQGPSAELCVDGIDNNCDGQVDEGCDCLPAPEVCDGIDNDCDGIVDEPPCPPADEITQVEAGDAHVCVLGASGRVRCWGNNAHGQLGDGTLINRSLPVEVIGLDSVLQIAAGRGHTCALMSTRDIRCWGDNRSGQLGDGTLESRSAPGARVAGLNDVMELRSEANASSTCAVDGAGEVRCWGRYVGDGSSEARALPTVPIGLPASHSASPSFQGGCSLALDGAVHCWGRNAASVSRPVGNPGPTVPELVPGLRAIDMRPAKYHTCTLRPDGQISCWGRNTFGELGITSATVDAGITDLPAPARSLRCGGGHCCAILEADPGQVFGPVYCWGYNSLGQAHPGDPDTSSWGPAAIVQSPRALQVAAGDVFSCALSDAGLLLCWGLNSSGELGRGFASGTELPGPVLGL